MAAATCLPTQALPGTKIVATVELGHLELESQALQVVPSSNVAEGPSDEGPEEEGHSHPAALQHLFFVRRHAPERTLTVRVWRTLFGFQRRLLGSGTVRLSSLMDGQTHRLQLPMQLAVDGALLPGQFGRSAPGSSAPGPEPAGSLPASLSLRLKFLPFAGEPGVAAGLRWLLEACLASGGLGAGAFGSRL